MPTGRTPLAPRLCLLAGLCLLPPAHAPAADAGSGDEPATPEPGGAPSPWPSLSADPHLTFDTGADLTRAAAWTLGHLEERIFRPLEGASGGAAARLARALLVDAPLAWWLGVVQHEAFGHGGRARELGKDATVHLGSPWGGRDSFASFEVGGLSNEDLLRVYTGGGESNGRAATRLEREVVGGRALHPTELLLLVSGRFVASDYVLRTTPDPVREPAAFNAEWQGGGDVANYLGYLSTRFTGSPGISPAGVSAEVERQHRRLRRQARWNALDPGAWLSLWSVGRWVAGGGDPMRVRLPRAAGRSFLPVFSADWLPDGGVASVELIVGPRSAAGPAARRWTSFTARRGRGPAGTLGALGAATDRLLTGARLQVGGEAEVWRRPGHGVGGGARVRLGPARGRLQGLYVDVGLKSDGHWPGQPAGTGPFVSIGVEFPR